MGVTAYGGKLKEMVRKASFTGVPRVECEFLLGVTAYRGKLKEMVRKASFTGVPTLLPLL